VYLSGINFWEKWRHNPLNLNEHTKKYIALNKWFNSPQGLWVGKAFADEIICFNSQLRGERLLQLGHCGQNPWLNSLHYRRNFIVSPCNNQPRTTVATLFNQLPFERDSFDCIIAPLTFEAYSFDKNPIDELDRVLKPMGHIIFWGINPFSFWGLALKLGCLSVFRDIKTKSTSFFSVKHALLSRGYRQCALSTFYYIPPINQEKMLNRLEFLNEMGKMLWLYPAGFYCLVVQKHEIITPSLTLKTIEENYLVCADSPVS